MWVVLHLRFLCSLGRNSMRGSKHAEQSRVDTLTFPRPVSGLREQIKITNNNIILDNKTNVKSHLFCAYLLSIYFAGMDFAVGLLCCLWVTSAYSNRPSRQVRPCRLITVHRAPPRQHQSISRSSFSPGVCFPQDVKLSSCHRQIREKCCIMASSTVHSELDYCNSLISLSILFIFFC